MSKASERARALLAEAHRPTESVWTIAAEHEALKRDGLLATLAGEVEAFEGAALETWPVEHVEHGAAWLVARVMSLEDDNECLQRALEGARLVGHGLGQADGSIVACGAESTKCCCGAAEHNARIDAALAGKESA